MGITAHSSVEGFFQEVLAEALTHSGMTISPSTGYYLVGLLGDYSRGQITDKPLGMRLVNTEDSAERVQALKEIGDTSLYVSGFFAESVSRQLVDVDYYIGMGGAAYRELSGRMGTSTVGEVYAELSQRFPAFVEVLARIRSQVNFTSNDLVSLYQEWQRTRADWVEERLAKMGLVVSPESDQADSEGGDYLQ